MKSNIITSNGTVLLTNHEDVSVLVVQSIIPFTFFNPQSFFSFFGQTATLNHALIFPKYLKKTAGSE